MTVLYLNPIFRARTNHRYDTGDYAEIDPILGGQKAFDGADPRGESPRDPRHAGRRIQPYRLRQPVF